MLPSRSELLAGITGALLASATMIVYARFSSRRAKQTQEEEDYATVRDALQEMKEQIVELLIHRKNGKASLSRSPSGASLLIDGQHQDGVNQQHMMSGVPSLLRQNSAQTTIYQIAITGGPCAGKSTCLSRIQQDFSARGYSVYILPEFATISIHAGVNPRELSRTEYVEWQASLIRMQIYMEEEFQKMAMIRGRKALIVTDRGTMDSRAYLKEEEWIQVCDENNWDVAILRDQRYHGVIHLTTAASGAENFYTKENNEARMESADEAVAVDKNTYEAWVGHENLTIIDNSTGFEDKVIRAMQVIAATVGEPQFGRVTKILVEVTGNITCNFVEHLIVQHMLISGARLTMKTTVCGNGIQTFIFRTKPGMDKDNKVFYREDIITARQYIKLLGDADPDQHIIKKIRRTFVYNRQVLLLDEFLEPVKAAGKVVLQLQKNIDSEANLPSFLSKVEDVTHRVFFSTRRVRKRSDSELSA